MGDKGKVRERQEKRLKKGKKGEEAGREVVEEKERGR